jgi:hypothetical protein
MENNLLGFAANFFKWNSNPSRTWRKGLGLARGLSNFKKHLISSPVPALLKLRGL